jgi:FKBP-type peptidyl-prolyl cis-trans isomerase
LRLNTHLQISLVALQMPDFNREMVQGTQARAKIPVHFSQSGTRHKRVKSSAEQLSTKETKESKESKESMTRHFAFLAVLALAALVAAQAGNTNSPAAKKTGGNKPSKAQAAAKSPAGPTRVSGQPVTTPSGLEYWEIKKGTGPIAVNGKTVSVHYTGWLANGKEFDSSLDLGDPIEFVLGQGRVIKGWDEGIAGMKVGGKRQLRIPPELGYGTHGAPPTIPPNATLIFDVQLVAVK